MLLTSTGGVVDVVRSVDVDVRYSTAYSVLLRGSRIRVSLYIRVITTKYYLMPLYPYYINLARAIYVERSISNPLSL